MANSYHPRFRTMVLADARFPPPFPKRWFEYLGLNRLTYSSYLDDIPRRLEIARAARPDVIRGKPHELFLLAQALREQGATEVAPRMVFASAELLDDTTRSFINETFGVELADFYGSTECGWIAWECSSHAGYHINTDQLIVEFLRDGRPVALGEPGEVVVTNLHSQAMPFIRYSVGDVGTPLAARCPCGRGLPLMRTVEGRTIDCLTLPGGRLISPYRLINTVEKVVGAYRYQVVQSSPDTLTVRVIPGPAFAEDTLGRIKEELVRLLDGKLDVDPVVVEELPKDSSGKFRVVQGLQRPAHTDH